MGNSEEWLRERVRCLILSVNFLKIDLSLLDTVLSEVKRDVDMLVPLIHRRRFRSTNRALIVDLDSDWSRIAFASDIGNEPRKPNRFLSREAKSDVLGFA